MKLAFLFKTNGTLGIPSPKANPFRIRDQGRPPTFVPVESVDNRPIQTGFTPGVGTRKAGSRWSARFEKFCLGVILTLFASTVIACGFGVQRIQHNREKYRLGQQIKQRERELAETKKICRNLEGIVALYAARDFQQNAARQAALARPKPKGIPNG